MDRRSFLQSSSAFAGLGLLNGCARHIAAPAASAPPPLRPYEALGPIPPIRAHVDRIFRITVCLRPFRAAGPRMEVERLNDKLIVHNYGHGGSGWSLSWGCAQVTVNSALQALEGGRDLAVIGCGALGLTSALAAQRAGLKVTIYAKERPPFVRSSRATGSWTPDSRIALTSAAPSTFAAQWESMARASFAMYQSFLGSAGDPVEWTDRYVLSDTPHGQGPAPEDHHGFARYNHLIADLTPQSEDIDPAQTPFPTPYVRRNSSLTFNIASYSRQLLNDFLIAGGLIETREFHSPSELASLPQRVVVNCTGYAARQLFSDDSIVPVRGQIAWLIPQEGVHYGLNYKDLNVLARRDGIAIQPSPGGEDFGWNDDNETPDRAAAEAGVLQLQQLYLRPRSARPAA